VTQWIGRLRAHALCSGYLDQFLDLIENGMLVVEERGKERISAEELSSVLSCLREKVEKADFAVKPISTDGRAPPRM
jgi:hypothetical protein